jgi:hypothetical protein
MDVIESSESVQTVNFHDVGALAWYLTKVSWTVPGFDIVAQRDALERLHREIERRGPLRIPQVGMYLLARKLRVEGLYLLSEIERRIERVYELVLA